MMSRVYIKKIKLRTNCFLSTPKSMETEEKTDLNNELSNNSCFNEQRRAAGDSLTIDTIINLVRL